jgi:hypothetical protein
MFQKNVIVVVGWLVDDENGDTHSKIVDPLYILHGNMPF